MEEQLKRMALHDPLTLLANRSLFRDRVEHAVAVSKRNGRSVAVMFVDLDNFKRINDSFGHADGDRVLHKSAQRLVKATRNGDTVARLGGDEFAVLLENLTGAGAGDGDRRAHRRVAAGAARPAGRGLRIAASVGVAFSTADDGVEELMRNADVAMYSAKSRARPLHGLRAVHAARRERAPGNGGRARHRRCNEGQFLLHYQPIVELHSGYLLGVEALIRWQHPKRGLIAPGGIHPGRRGDRARSSRSAAGCSPRPAAR